MTTAAESRGGKEVPGVGGARETAFAEVLAEWPVERVRELIYSRNSDHVRRAMRAKRFAPADLAALLAPAAADFLEPVARQAAVLTRQRFGYAVQFYVPLYVSNFCVNSCLYCGFNRHNRIRRMVLPYDDAVREAEHLAREGFRHLLLVSGEDPEGVPVDYFEELAERLRGKFASLNIEIYPLDEAGYRRLVEAGVDSLTLYQETYDRDAYRRFHPAGPKRNFSYRLGAVERGARAGISFLGVGALLGLTDWRIDSFYVGLHAHYLQTHYWRQHVSISFPRLRHAAGDFTPPYPVSDAALVQVMCGLRLQLPDAGLVLSTRESARFRDHVLPLGITRISAGSRTTPGGYSEETKAEGQFDVQDRRSLREVMDAIAARGFDPVCKDWDSSYHARL